MENYRGPRPLAPISSTLTAQLPSPGRRVRGALALSQREAALQREFALTDKGRRSRSMTDRSGNWIKPLLVPHDNSSLYSRLLEARSRSVAIQHSPSRLTHLPKTKTRSWCKRTDAASSQKKVALPGPPLRSLAGGGGAKVVSMSCDVQTYKCSVR